ILRVARVPVEEDSGERRFRDRGLRKADEPVGRVHAEGAERIEDADNVGETLHRIRRADAVERQVPVGGVHCAALLGQNVHRLRGDGRTGGEAAEQEEDEARYEDEVAHACILPSSSEEDTSELQSRENLVCRLLLAKKKAA